MAGVSTVKCPECGENVYCHKSSVNGELLKHWGVEVRNASDIKNPVALSRANKLISAIPVEGE